jgi:hypothetical protein
MSLPSPPSPPIVSLSALQAGDVLLCYSRMMDEVHVEMAGYSHVAICLDGGRVLQADVGGVTIDPVASLLDSYDHLAVFRNGWGWDAAAVLRLHAFAAGAAGKPFNRRGMLSLPVLQQTHAEEVMQELSDFFATGSIAPRHQTSYFCSQLVAEALIEAGLIGQAAGIVLHPSTTSPRGVSLDAVYGAFIGYVLPAGYTLPANDRFRLRW